MTPQLGGLARRASKIREIRNGGTPLLLLESGDFLAKEKPRTKEETAAARGKADFLLRAYRAMGYDAVLPGELDFAAGIALLSDHGKKGVPFVCLNLLSERTGKPLFLPYRRFSRGGITVLVTGLASESVFPRGALAGFGLTVLPPGEALFSLLARREAEADVVIVLSHLGFSEDLELAKRAGRPLLVLGAHSRIPVWVAEAKSGSILSVPKDRGMFLREISIGTVAGGGTGPAGFADGALVDQYEAQRRDLLARGKEMDRKERELAERTLEAYKRMIVIPDGRRLTIPREHPLDEKVPDDPEMVRMHGEYRKTLERQARPLTPGPIGHGEGRRDRSAGGQEPRNERASR
ncbi:MAG TPA: hypothetical protein VFU42_05840 [Candidatus Deferrimicrobiaceae bacterium]|nr:hypothetical protein [Candidatus Deferrimicrobiaceae bacterium]